MPQTAILVVDASVAIKWFFADDEKEAETAVASAILKGFGDSALQLIQPPHWAAEIIAVVARKRPEKAAAVIDLLALIEAPVDVDSGVYRLAADLAIEFNHHLFDTLYHALALERRAELVTADAHYFRKAEPKGSIRLLADYHLA